MPVAASALSHGSEDWSKISEPEDALELWKSVLGIGDATAKKLVEADFWAASTIPFLADKDYARATFPDLTAGMCVNISEASKAWFPGTGTPRSAALAGGSSRGGQKLSVFPAWPSEEGWPSVDEQRVMATKVKGWATERPTLYLSVRSVIDDPSQPKIPVPDEYNQM